MLQSFIHGMYCMYICIILFNTIPKNYILHCLRLPRTKWLSSLNQFCWNMGDQRHRHNFYFFLTSLILSPHTHHRILSENKTTHLPFLATLVAIPQTHVLTNHVMKHDFGRKTTIEDDQRHQLAGLAWGSGYTPQLLHGGKLGSVSGLISSNVWPS